MPQASRRPGFTLIEMVVVLLIVGILASAAMPLLALNKRRAQEAELRQNLRTLRAAIDAYHQAWEDGRIERKADDNGYPPTLQHLVQGVPDIASPRKRRLYFLRSLPSDPFADPNVPPADTWALRSYASPPEAPVPGADVFDVRSRSQALGLDGTALNAW
jgi:general secretion pathway protein G